MSDVLSEASVEDEREYHELERYDGLKEEEFLARGEYELERAE